MARLGQGLIQGLINPNYGDKLHEVGLMAGSLPTRMREEEKLRDQKIQQTAFYNTLNQQDATNPAVMQQALQMGVAAGLDPVAAQAAIADAQAQQRGVAGEQRDQKAELRAQETARQRQAEAKYAQAAAKVAEQKERTIQEQQNVAKAVEGVIARNPNQLDNVLVSVPEEHRAFAREYAKTIQEYETGRKDRLDSARRRTPLTEEDLSVYANVLGKEAIDGYRTASRISPIRARETLENNYNEVLKQKKLAEVATKAESMKPPTEAEVLEAQTLVDKAFPGQGWFGTGASTIGESGETILARSVASKRRTDPLWAATEENMMELAREIGVLDAPLQGEEEEAEVQEEQVDRQIQDQAIRPAPPGIDPEYWANMLPEDRELFE